MQEMGSREFQLKYQRLTEPVKVVSRMGPERIIGYFYPGPTPPKFGHQEGMFSEIEPAPPGHKPPPDAVVPKDDIDDLI